MEDRGILKVVELTGVNGAETLNVSPSSGRKWAIIDVYGYHDDTTADLAWAYIDGLETTSMTETPITRLTNVHHPFDGSTRWGALYADTGHYPRLVANVIATGHYLYARALVREWMP